MLAAKGVSVDYQDLRASLRKAHADNIGLSDIATALTNRGIPSEVRPAHIAEMSQIACPLIAYVENAEQDYKGVGSLLVIARADAVAQIVTAYDCITCVARDIEFQTFEKEYRGVVVSQRTDDWKASHMALAAIAGMILGRALTQKATRWHLLSK